MTVTAMAIPVNRRSVFALLSLGGGGGRRESINCPFTLVRGVDVGKLSPCCDPRGRVPL